MNSYNPGAGGRDEHDDPREFRGTGFEGENPRTLATDGGRDETGGVCAAEGCSQPTGEGEECCCDDHETVLRQGLQVL